MEICVSSGQQSFAPEQGPGTSQFDLIPMKESVSLLQTLAARSSWWLISLLLHALVILLASLLSMAIELPSQEEAVVMVTELSAIPKSEVNAPMPKPSAETALLSKVETPPTDPTSKEASDIIVPPEILEKAELGDHFETINPDRPDTHSAFGNADAHIFHTVKGDDSAAGGGGNNGVGVEDLIGVGGAGSAGTGGGWGGGNGTGIGTDNGAGHGSFGNRNGGGRRLMVKRHGGSAATESAVDLALDWLARHQQADGSWSMQNTEGQDHADPGITGLATLAFLGAGHTEKVGKYKENVTRAVAWIIAQQRDDGAIGTDPKFAEHHGGFAYNHAICGLALAEAAGMAMLPTTKKAAQKAVNYSCEIHQAGEGSDKLGWRYHPKAAGDMSASGWFIMQLKSARIAGLSVDPLSFEGAVHFLDKCEEDPSKVKIEDSGYDEGKHRYGYTGPGAMVNTTSIGILCRLFLGYKADDCRGAAMWLLRTNPPAWRADLGVANGGGWPMYYMYYTTLTMFQLGGDQWRQWNDGLKKVLVENQRKDGDARGSWDALSSWEKRIGRTYTTALGALSLEVYYRYQQIAH